MDKIHAKCEILPAVPHVKPIDILFLDHDKDDYLPTLRALESKGLIAKDLVSTIYPKYI